MKLEVVSINRFVVCENIQLVVFAFTHNCDSPSFRHEAVLCAYDRVDAVCNDICYMLAFHFDHTGFDVRSKRSYVYIPSVEVQDTLLKVKRNVMRTVA